MKAKSINNENLKRGHEIYDEVISSFSYVVTDDDSSESWSYPASYGEVKYAREKISEIESLQIQDDEFLDKLEDLKEICDKALKRRFKASKAVLFAAGIWMVVNIFMASNDLFKNFEGFYTLEEVSVIYNETINIHKLQIEYYESIIDRENSKEFLEEHSQKLKALENVSIQDYFNQKNLESRNKAIKNVKVAILSILLYLAYIFACRTPMFLVYRKRKDVEWMRERGYSGGLFKSALSSLWAIPVEASTWEVKEKHEDGRVTVRQESDMGEAGGFIKILLIAFVLIVAFYAMIIALPFLILINYLRNYQYIFLEKASTGFLSFLFKRKHPSDEERVDTVSKMKRDLPLLKDIQKGDSVLATYSGDNYLYIGTVEEIMDKNLLICYLDGSKEEVSRKDTCLISYGINNLYALAYREDKGQACACKILENTDGFFLVKYEDETTEKHTGEQIRFY